MLCCCIILIQMSVEDAGRVKLCLALVPCVVGAVGAVHACDSLYNDFVSLAASEPTWTSPTAR